MDIQTTPRTSNTRVRRRVARLVPVAFAAAALLAPGLAAAAEDGGGGGGGMGGPTSLLFTLTWETNDGVVHDSLPAPAAAGFGAVSFNAGGKEMGTATCTQAAGAAALLCDYQNQGHGSLPGLVLPMSPKATFTVTVTDVPPGWSVDPGTVGTFTGGEVCPREGGDEGEGGHETTTTTTTSLEPVAPAAEEGEGGEGGGGGSEPHVCYHNVALVQDPAPPAPPVVPTPEAAVEAAQVAAAPVAASPAVTG